MWVNFTNGHITMTFFHQNHIAMFSNTKIKTVSSAHTKVTIAGKPNFPMQFFYSTFFIFYFQSNKY